MENTLAGVAGKKFILSYSCGKDSTLCLHKMLEAGAEPMALLVMFNPEAGRSYFHGVDPALLKEYGEALELPLLAVPTGGEEYHLSMEAALRRAKEQVGKAHALHGLADGFAALQFTVKHLILRSFVLLYSEPSIA